MTYYMSISIDLIWRKQQSEIRLEVLPQMRSLIVFFDEDAVRGLISAYFLLTYTIDCIVIDILFRIKRVF